MSFEDALSISASGVEANRLYMEIIASNLANVNTTRTIGGGPYVRKIPIFEEREISFDAALSEAEEKISGLPAAQAGGVVLKDIVEDAIPFQKIYKPGHPDADKEGFVKLPNVSLSKEMVDLMQAQRLHEANITAYNATKKMMQDTMQLP